MSLSNTSSRAGGAAVAVLVACLAFLETSTVARGQTPTPVPAPAPAPAGSVLKPVAPDSLAVLLHDGKGVTNAWFTWPSTPAPAITPSDARSAINTVAATAIEIAPAPMPVDAPAGLVLYTIRVNSREFRPGTDYTAYLLATKQAPISLRIQEVGGVQFSAAPNALTHTWRMFQNPCTRVSIVNSGHAAIDTITAVLTAQTSVGLSLQDSNIATPITKPIGIGEKGSVDVCPPIPDLAGSYAGSLAIRANDRKEESVAFTVTSRGPTLSSFIGKAGLALPFLMFVFVLILGLIIATRLGDWHDSGLKRTETAITLGTLATDLVGLRDRLAALGNTTHTVAQLDVASTEAKALMTGSVSDNTDAAIARLSFIRSGAQWATLLLQAIKDRGGVIQPGITELEKNTLPVDQGALDKFRQAIETALTPAASTATAAAALPPAALSTVEDLKKHRDTMASLQRLLLWSTSAMAAYSLYYVNNPAFGTLLDYFAVFAWALAFTEAGSQILSKARWPGK